MTQGYWKGAPCTTSVSIFLQDIRCYNKPLDFRRSLNFLYFIQSLPGFMQKYLFFWRFFCATVKLSALTKVLFSVSNRFGTLFSSNELLTIFFCSSGGLLVFTTCEPHAGRSFFREHLYLCQIRETLYLKL